MISILYLLVSSTFAITLFTSEFSSGSFVDIIPSKRDRKQRQPTSTIDNSKDHSDDEDADSTDSELQLPKLFSCTEDGCIKSFQRYSSLQYHIQFGNCVLKPERLSLLDKAKVLYTEKLTSGAGEQATIKSTDTLSTSHDNSPPQGWALKVSKSNVRFTEQQKQYLNEKFAIGKETGHKVDPAVVSRDMRYAKDFQGNRRFTLEEFLTPTQIQSYFSRKSSKEKRANNLNNEDLVSAKVQEEYSNVRSTVLSQCQLQHPVAYDAYNLCNMSTKNTLKKLSVSLLKQICEHFHIDTSGVSKARLKAPYINLIQDMIKSCTCMC